MEDPLYAESDSEEAVGGAHALAKLLQFPCDSVLLDRNLPDLDASEVAEQIRKQFPRVEVELLDARFVGVHPQDTEIREQLDASMTDTAVLVTGETGTGKKLVAGAIHQLSKRARHSFVIVNCAAIPETLLEAELFGHARGAFTGAVQSRLGRIHVAQGGTLFLDEIGELPLSMQAKLLRFLQNGEVQRLGSSDVYRVDVRVVCATNVRLSELVKARQFREDLY